LLPVRVNVHLYRLIDWYAMPQPVVALLRHFAILQAALTTCLDAPKPKHVHKLRSTARRIEALLELLKTSAKLTGLKRGSKALSRSLRKIRRVAGDVRDLDVHLELVKGLKAGSAADPLVRDLSTAREKALGRLQRIERDQKDLRSALAELEIVLAPAIDLDLSGAELAKAARAWLGSALRDLDPRKDDELHKIRKACKTARYIADVGSDVSKNTARLAARLNAVQRATGEWHDWLLLLDEARESVPENRLLLDGIQATAEGLRRRAEPVVGRLLPG
jgi:CHAD domain-containing protein